MKEEMEHKRLSDIQREKFKKGLREAPKIWEKITPEEQVGDLTVKEEGYFSGRLKIDIKNLPIQYIRIYNEIKSVYGYDKETFIKLLEVFVEYKSDELIERLKERIETIKKLKDEFSRKVEKWK